MRMEFQGDLLALVDAAVEEQPLTDFDVNSEEFSSGLTDISPLRITTLKEKNLTTRQRERSSCRG